MSAEKLQKLKKYLFYISIIFVTFSFAHLVYTYFYYDSKLIPIKGGNISEGIIGEYPSLNPLLSDNGNNAYLTHLLYRSLLQYDTTTSKISADIMSCGDMSNLLRVECYLENNVKWSDGEPITADDIIATYKLLQNSNINPVMSSLLANTEITQTDASIIFINPNKDINFLNIFFQPILPASVINNLSESALKGKFSADTSVYSGKFKLNSIHSDSSIGVTKFFLEKNDQYNGKEIFINQMIIKLFPNTTELLRNKESIHIVADRNNILGNSIPRLKSHPYTLNQYVGVFLNKDTMSDASMRTFVLNNIKRENLITLLGKENFKEVYNPYLSETVIDTTPSNKNIDDIIRALGYKRKSEILAEFIVSEKKRQNYSGEVVLENTTEEKIYTLEDFQAESKTVFSPSYVEKYNYITNPNITLKGNVAENTQAVYINDYKLTGYNPGNTEFAYGLKDVLEPGVNIYNIYFEIDDEKKLQEEITFVYNSDKAEVDKILAELVKKLGDEEDIRKAKIAQENRASAQPFKLDPEKRAEIEALDDESFYNETLEKFGFTLFYTDTSDYISDTATYIQTSLEEKGIHITLEPITLAGLPQLLKQKDQYDIILAGINTGYFDFNIFPYFHSSQAEIGYNFSGTKKLSIDILLEELKSSLLGTKKIDQLQEKVLQGLKEEQVVKTLYTPILNNLVDKNINNYKSIDHLPNDHLRIDALGEIYINEKKIIDFSQKKISGFFKFLIDILNG